MYKIQMKAQKWICLICLIAGVLSFLYALGMMTDLYDTLYYVIPDPEMDPYVEGAMIYYEMQPFNNTLLILSIVQIVLSVLLFVTNTHSRRRYYVTNYIAVGLNAAAGIALPIWAHLWIGAYRTQYLKLNFEDLKMWLEIFEHPYSDSTFWFDIHTVVLVVTLVSTALLLLNLIWKIMLMIQEKKLIAEGKAVAA